MLFGIIEMIMGKKDDQEQEGSAMRFAKTLRLTANTHAASKAGQAASKEQERQQERIHSQ